MGFDVDKADLKPNFDYYTYLSFRSLTVSSTGILIGGAVSSSLIRIYIYFALFG
jgi:hypothetical protein